MNENEIQRIAAMANALRPDWPVPSLVTLLSKPGLVNRSRRDAAVALTWVACDSASKTPARVLESGPWWTAVADATDGGKPRVDYDNRCRTCNYPEPACRQLAEQMNDPHEFVRWGDVRAGRVPPELPCEMPENLRRGGRMTRCREDHPDPTDQPDAEGAK
jgi:hypothetical protein